MDMEQIDSVEQSEMGLFGPRALEWNPAFDP